MVVIDDRPPDRRHHIQALLRPPLPADELAMVLESPRALGSLVALGICRVHLHFDQVAPVSLAVGEAPSDMAVAPHDHGGRSRQRRSGDLEAAFGLTLTCGTLRVHLE